MTLIDILDMCAIKNCRIIIYNPITHTNYAQHIIAIYKRAIRKIPHKNGSIIHLIDLGCCRSIILPIMWSS